MQWGVIDGAGKQLLRIAVNMIVSLSLSLTPCTVVTIVVIVSVSLPLTPCDLQHP